MMEMIDTTLQHRVCTVLEGNNQLRGRKVHFFTEKGRVTLQGSVDSFYVKQLAQEAVRKIDGVEEITNELEVGYKSGI
jgi:osmotically-inducible protein OsmY